MISFENRMLWSSVICGPNRTTDDGGPHHAKTSLINLFYSFALLLTLSFRLSANIVLVICECDSDEGIKIEQHDPHSNPPNYPSICAAELSVQQLPRVNN